MNPRTAIRFISAGAGSGKTTALAELLQRELSAGRVQPGGLLATTFTQRAAGELRERVHSELIRTGKHAVAGALTGTQIGTVNGVCGGLLQRFAFEAGLSPELQVLDEDRAARLLRESLDSVMAGPALAELMATAQRLSLLDPPRPGELAPWRKALRSLVDQARANAIDAEALRNCGPANAEQLLAHFPALRVAPTEPTESTAAANPADPALRLAITQALPQLMAAAGVGGKKNTAAYVELLEAALKDLDAGVLTWAARHKLAGAAPEKALLAMASPVAQATAQLTSHPALQHDLRRYLVLMFDLAATALDAYAQAKRQLGVVDFIDQERLLLDLLDHPFVATTLADELDLLLVDEFQDTSPIQLALFLKLGALARQVVWVGDIKQAIYGFRGSDTRLMRAVLAALPARAGGQDTLPYSWRSRPALVGFVNRVFGDAFAGLHRDEVTLIARRPEFTGCAALADWHLAGRNKAELQRALAAGLARLVAERTRVVDQGSGALRDVVWSDIAVLSRSNDGVTGVAAALRAAGIPCATAQPGLLGQPEAVLALACLRRLNDEHDTLATAELMSLADCAQPEQWLADRLSWLAGGGLASAWQELPSGERDAHPMLVTLAALRTEALLLTPREALEQVITRCGLARCVIQWQRDADLAQVRLAHLDRLLDLAAQYEEECGASLSAASLSGLLRWLADLAAAGADALAQPAGVNAVQVLTHHGAKGLEWPVVVLCDLASAVRDRLWDVQAEPLQSFDLHQPLAQRWLRYWPWPFGAQKSQPLGAELAATPAGQAARAEAVAQDQRLLYVSMTRARDMLVLARPAKALVGEWMETVALASCLPLADVRGSSGAPDGALPFVRWQLDGDGAPAAVTAPVGDLVWWLDGAVARRPG
jgi:ATP-dependent helicase/nuclease subunit A